MTVADHKYLNYWRSLPPLQITMAEAKKLPEYSATNPTGVTPGKRWRRHNGVFDRTAMSRGVIPRWVICEYQEAAPEMMPSREIDPETGKRKIIKVEMCKTVTYRPVIRVKAECAALAPCDDAEFGIAP